MGFQCSSSMGAMAVRYFRVSQGASDDTACFIDADIAAAARSGTRQYGTGSRRRRRRLCANWFSDIYLPRLQRIDELYADRGDNRYAWSYSVGDDELLP